MSYIPGQTYDNGSWKCSVIYCDVKSLFPSFFALLLCRIVLNRIGLYRILSHDNV